MDYTKNHHLPQWAEQDRIMRTDFNQMCKDIDAGLTQGKSDLTAGLAKAQTDLTAVDTRLSNRLTQAEQYAATLSTKTAVLDGLRRMAYNHLYLAELTPNVRQMGLFIQHFDKGAKVSIDGMLQQDDFLWMCNGAEALALSNVQSSIVVLQEMRGTDTFEMTFTLPYSGILNYVELAGSFSNNINHNRGDCTLSIHNKDSGALVLEKKSSLGLVNTSAMDGNAFRLSVNERMHSGSYRLKAKLDLLNFTINMGLNRVEGRSMGLTGLATSTASIQRALAGGEVRSGGLALVQYNTWGAGGSPTLLWDGATIRPATTRTITNNQGQSVKEAEFRRYTDVPANSTIKLNLSCNSGGEVSLYRWGAVLL